MTAVAVLLLVASCSSSLERRRASTPAPAETTKVGEGLLERLPSPASDDGDGEARPLLVLTLDDQNGLHPEGIPVRIEGTQQRTAFTDANGEVRIVDRPGVYEFRVVEGCHDELEVLAGGYATVGITSGQTQRGSLPVEWRHRHVPSAPVLASVAGDWRIGSPVDLRFDVVDHCADDSRAPGAWFPSFVFRPGPTLEVVGEPSLVADPDGRGRVSVRCTSEGDAQLLAEDSRNPSDSFDLVGAIVAFGTRPRCAAS